MTDYFEHLGQADLDAPGQTVKNARPMIRHECEHCGGTGKWPHGINRFGERKCFACKGNGFFKTSARARAKVRNANASNKVKRLAAAQSRFNESNDGLIADLRGMTNWNGFATSLVEQYDKKGDLSERQIESANRMIAKTHATREAKRASAPRIDLSGIAAMFKVAKDNGLKRPTYRALGLILSLAPMHGVNAGAMYVKSDSGDYHGKITADHTYRAVNDPDGIVAKSLVKIAANPKEIALAYGKLTGSCSCCGRTLTDPTSIANGIGPICAGNFGF